MPTTLSEISRREQSERERAFRYERLVDRRTTLQAKIKKLTQPTANVSQLDQIIALAGQLEDNCMTKSRFGISGGASVRFTILSAAEDGKRAANIRETDRVADLAAAKKELASIEAELKAFD